MKLIIRILAVAFAMAFTAVAMAQTSPVVGRWRNEAGNAVIAVSITADGTLQGVGAGGNNPDRRDIKNPDPKLRDRKLLGAKILWGFKPDNDEKTKWVDGQIYDPDNGKTYDCKLRLEDGKLRIRGYVGISWFGRTTVWTRDAGTLK
ncbi:MAG: DUF2147 domain-containing protein [Myxococcota bacterium]